MLRSKWIRWCIAMMVLVTSVVPVGSNMKAIADTGGIEEPANLVVNPGFEEGATGWNFGSYSVTEEQVMSGAKALKGTLKSGNQAYQYIDIKPNTKYRIAVDALTTTKYEVQVKTTVPPLTVIGVSPKVATGSSQGQWKHYEGYFHSGDLTKVQFLIQNFNSQYGYFDNFVLEEVPPAAAIIADTPEMTIRGVGGVAQAGSRILLMAAEQLIVWSSMTPELLSVSSGGMVTSHAAGTGTVRAASLENPELYTDITVHVIAGAVDIFEDELMLWGEGDQATLHANQAVDWSSNEPGIASVDTSGVVTATGIGTAQITASSVVDAVYTDSLSVVVQDATITLTPAQAVLDGVGETVQLTANHEVSWSSLDPSVATVSETGVVTAVGNGETEIKAANLRNDLYTSTATITVQTPEVQLNREALTLYGIGSRWSFLANHPQIAWSSSDEAVVTVTDTGIATAAGLGTATIRAVNMANTDYSAEAIVSVEEAALIHEDFFTDADRFTVMEVIEGGAFVHQNQSYRLNLTSASTTKVLGNYSLHEQAIMGDFEIEMKFAIDNTGSAWNDGGIVFSHVDKDNFFFVDVAESVDGGVHGVFRVMDGKVEKVLDFGNTTLIQPGDPSELRIVNEGGQLSVYYTGKFRNPEREVENYLLGTVYDPTFNSGQTGVGSKNDMMSIYSFVVRAAAHQDVEAPQAPQLERATVGQGRVIELVWEPAADNIGTVGYEVLRDGTVVGTTSLTQYTDAGLEPGKLYTYAVRALDYSGNTSAASDSVKLHARKVAETTDQLTWSPPELVDPITIEVNNSNNNLKLQRDKDYIIRFTEKITAPFGLRIDGNYARNIVMVGGEIDIPWQGDWFLGDTIEDHEASVNESFFNQRRGLYIKNWSGTFHIEGLWIHGEDLSEGIDIDTRAVGSILQLQNVRIDGVKGRPEESRNYTAKHIMHPDLVQNWGGPTYYRIDGFTGDSDYQGFMVQPVQFSKNMVTETMDWRNMNVKQEGASGFLIYRSIAGTNTIWLENTYFEPNKPGSPPAYPIDDPRWKQIGVGQPPGGDFVLASEEGGIGIAGMNYVSPGYIPAEGMLISDTAVELSGVGDTYQVKATMRVHHMDQAIEWSVVEGEVITVSPSGLITAIGTGEATLRAASKADPSIYKEVSVTVYEPATEIVLVRDGLDTELDRIGQTLQPEVQVLPGDTANPKVYWYSDNEAVAKVTPSGVIVAVGEGHANISVYSGENALLLDVLPVEVDLPWWWRLLHPKLPPFLKQMPSYLGSADFSGHGWGHQVVVTVESEEGATRVEAELPLDRLQGRSPHLTLTVHTQLGSITMHANTLKDLIEDGQTATLIIEQGDLAQLPEGVDDFNGDRPHIDVQLYVDSTEVAWTEAGWPMLVALPYDAPEQETKHKERLTAWQIDGDRVVQAPYSLYDAWSDKLWFAVSQFGSYAAVYVK